MIPVKHILELGIEIARGVSTLVPSRTRPKMASATKYGGKIVVCQPGSIDVAKSNQTVERTDKTSGVEMPERTRYAIS
jgi:hypothetical protein